MFHVQLQLIQLICSHTVHQFFQIIHGRDPASGHIMIKSTMFNLRFVLNVRVRKTAALLLRHLTQCLHTIKKSTGTAAGYDDSVCIYMQLIRLCFQCFIQPQANIPRTHTASCDTQRKSQ